MKCPVDNETLLMTERQGVEIDYCPKCRGIWLDRGELDKLIEVATRQTMPALAQAEPQREAREVPPPPPAAPPPAPPASAAPAHVQDPYASPAARASERMGFDQGGRRAPVSDPSDPRAPGNWNRKHRDDDDDDDRDDRGRGRKKRGFGGFLDDIFDF